MSTTAIAPSTDANDTLLPSGVNPFDFLPEMEILQHNPSSDTVLIDTDADKPTVVLMDKKELPYYMPDISWEGMVLKVNNHSFVARLTNIDDPTEQEEAEILNECVSDQDDLKLIAPGAIFFWSIARRFKGRRSEQISTILFRRLPMWSKTELEKASQEASRLKEELGW